MFQSTEGCCVTQLTINKIGSGAEEENGEDVKSFQETSASDLCSAEKNRASPFFLFSVAPFHHSSRNLIYYSIATLHSFTLCR